MAGYQFKGRTAHDALEDALARIRDLEAHTAKLTHALGRRNTHYQNLKTRHAEHQEKTRATIQRLRNQIRQMEENNATAAEAKRLQNIADHTNKQLARRVETMLKQAQTEARHIVAQAEHNAAIIREKAYDQGRALADRTYPNPRERQKDSTRARWAVINNHTPTRQAESRAAA